MCDFELTLDYPGCRWSRAIESSQQGASNPTESWNLLRVRLSVTRITRCFKSDTVLNSVSERRSSVVFRYVWQCCEGHLFPAIAKLQKACHIFIWLFCLACNWNLSSMICGDSLCLDVRLNDLKKKHICNNEKKGQVYVEKQGHHVHLSINGMTI